MIFNDSSLLKNKQKKSLETLSLLLKKTLGNKLDILEEKNKKDENILFSIKDESNKMKKFLEDSTKKSKYFII